MFIVTRMFSAGMHKKFAVIATAVLGLFVSSVASADKYPVISGTPKTSITTGSYYSFKPSARDPDGKKIVFSIKNKPSWAKFNGSTGELKGTPTKAGTYSNISIGAWDGRLTSKLPTFSIKVAASGSSGGTTNRAPTISGSPATSVTAGKAYSFTPKASDPEGKSLGFTIANRPSWATFSTSTGKLSGTPSKSHVGNYSNIKISVSDGKTTVSLPVFAIAVKAATTNPPPPSSSGTATLSWTPPTRNTDGSSLTNLAGYRLYYGTSAGSLNKTINLNTAGLSTYVVTDLAPATYYFAMTAYTSTGAESPRSAVVTKVVK